MLYAFIYLYCISDITSDIIAQTCHQVSTFRDLRFICLGKWGRKRTADQKLRKCCALKAFVRFGALWVHFVCNDGRKISSWKRTLRGAAVPCHGVAAADISAVLAEKGAASTSGLDRRVLHHFIIHHDVANVWTWTGAAASWMETTVSRLSPETP